MSGTLYGVGVGPGDPRLMTLLAIETIESCPVIAVPGENREHAVSYRIARGAVAGLEKKICLNLSTPMTKDPGILAKSYELAAGRIIEELKQNRDVAYLTLGDPTIYSTYIYIHRLVKAQGYSAEIINGIPSFCAVAARMGESLADRSEQLHIIPSSYDIEEALDYPGSKVFMKAGSKLSRVKQTLQEKDMTAVMVENCGFSDEHIYDVISSMPEKASYYTTVLVK
ncbi:MAG: precorrin-2 C(20)-methyltransferase [Lachnospiraceae bacterium]|nr:precorrin-2 C(20)-methyltransferase [Lachnospiraceae bacterium]